MIPKANLVVLSACDTFQGQLKTDGVVGVTRAFVAAGAQTLVASLWPVPDEATKILVQLFYRQLLEPAAGDPMVALQAAMRSMIHEGRPALQWASFVVYGLATKLNIGAPRQEDYSPLKGSLTDLLFAHVQDKNLRDKSLALPVDWCQQHGFESISQIKEAGKVNDFIISLQLKPIKARILTKTIDKYRG